MTALPRLHLVTSDRVLTAGGFQANALAILDAHRDAVALHVRGHGLAGRVLYDAAEPLARRGDATGALVLVNDRLDVALTAGAHGAQLGRRSLPLPAARALLGDAARIGYSAHAAREAAGAADGGADFVVLGAVYATASHPDRAGAGVGLVADTVRVVSAPVLAIGGVTPERVAELVAAGAHGVAVLSGVWQAAAPVAAAGRYLEALGRSKGGDAWERTATR